MATDIVQSLFGVTPQAYQQAQQDRADAQALQYAKLDPFQQANFAIGRGATGLAGALGGALGGQDPQLQMISARQAISKQINYNDPASIQQGVRMLSDAGDAQGAMMLADVGRQAASEIAQTGQRQAAGVASLAAAARERTQALPKEVQLAKEVALLSGFEEGTPQYNTAYATSLNEQMAPKVTPEGKTNIQKLQEYAATLSPGSAELAQVMAVIRAEAEGKGVKITNLLPGQPVPTKDWMDFTTKVLSGDPTMVRTSTIISDAPNAIDIIRSSTTNDISAAALPGALARLTGEGKNMSNQDVARFARTGGLEDRLVQDAVKFFSGRTSSVKREQAEQFATSLYRGALLERKKKLATEAEQFGYSESPNYKIALRQIDEQLTQIKVPGVAGATPRSAADQALLDKYPPKAK